MLKVVQIDPIEEHNEEVVEEDEQQFDQADRILARHGLSSENDETVRDVTILKDNYVYTAARRRKWKTRKSHKLGLRVAVDLPRFMKYPNTFKK
jgi:hypothetical protein